VVFNIFHTPTPYDQQPNIADDPLVFDDFFRKDKIFNDLFLKKKKILTTF
jgi:hypothetical protein